MSTIIACQTCAKAFAETTGDAAGYAILLMLCIIVPLASLVIFCFIRIAKRQKAFATTEFDDPFLNS